MAKEAKSTPSNEESAKVKTIAIAPLSGGFMIFSMLGFLISILIVYPRMPSFGFAFTIVFAVMFVASMISMTYGPAESELAMDYHKRKK